MFIYIFISDASSSSHLATNSSAFSLPMPPGLSSMLDTGGSNLSGPTSSATPSSTSLSLESRIQALFNINVTKSATPPPPPIPPVDTVAPPVIQQVNSPHFANQTNKSPQTGTSIEPSPSTLQDVPLPVSPSPVPVLNIDRAPSKSFQPQAPPTSDAHYKPSFYPHHHSHHQHQSKQITQRSMSFSGEKLDQKSPKEHPKPKAVRQVEQIKREGFKLIRSELKDIVRKDLLKKLIEQCSFKLIDEWEKSQSLPVNMSSTKTGIFYAFLYRDFAINGNF